MKKSIKESRFDIRGTIKNLFGISSEAETSPRDTIMNASDLTAEQKKILIDCLEQNEKNDHERFTDAVRHFNANSSIRKAEKQESVNRKVKEERAD